MVAGELAREGGGQRSVTALLIGGIAAVTSGIIGVFSVLRTQSFAGHSLADIATTGGSGAFLAGVNQFWGFLVAGLAASAAMEAIGVQRRRGRDVATGVVLGGGLGFAALFLYLGTQHTSTTGASFSLLFGSIFVVGPDTVPGVIAAGVVTLAVVALLGRRLLLTAISSDLARARGVNVRAGRHRLPDGAGRHRLAVGRRDRRGAVHRAARRPGRDRPAHHQIPGWAMVVSAATGLAATWIGIVLAYESSNWPPYGHGWPVSFFVVVLVLIGYLLSSSSGRGR